MRKRKSGRKLTQRKRSKKSLLESLANALILNEKIKTTEAKAKELSSFVEKYITKAKKDDLNSTRLLRKFFPEKIVKKLIKEIGPRYQKRKGGYTRVVKLSPRKSDGAKMAIIELVK